jgi:hypothetical protein
MADITEAQRYYCVIVVFSLRHRAMCRGNVKFKTLKMEVVYFSESIVSSARLKVSRPRSPGHECSQLRTCRAVQEMTRWKSVKEYFLIYNIFTA